MLENNPAQHLFVDESFGMTNIRKQDIRYFLPSSPELLEAVKTYLDFEKWSGITAEERNQIIELFELELARKFKGVIK